MATIGHTMPQPMTTISHLLYMPTTLCVSCDVPQASRGFWESNFRLGAKHPPNQGGESLKERHDS